MDEVTLSIDNYQSFGCWTINRLIVSIDNTYKFKMPEYNVNVGYYISSAAMVSTIGYLDAINQNITTAVIPNNYNGINITTIGELSCSNNNVLQTLVITVYGIKDEFINLLSNTAGNDCLLSVNNVYKNN